jgi:subtilase family serine protease
MNDFHPQSHLKVLGQAQFNPKTHQATPQWTYPESGGVSFVMAPGDFAMQYDINSVYKAGITGAGQSIAIVSASNVDLSLVQAYQSLFGLSANLPQVVVDGEDPGQNSAATEAYLDIEIAGSVAPGATVILYTSGGTALTDGLALAAMRAVEDDQAGIISASYGECEMELGQSGNSFWSALWQQAAAQGQTVFVSTGDGGSAGCDDYDTQQAAYSGLQVNGLASTPYNVAVGGTDFYYSQYAGSSSAISTQLGTYWSTTSTTAPAVSLKQTIPEQAWNDFFGFNLYDGGNPANQSSENIVAGGGGASSAAVYPSGSAAGYPKPAWQAGTGVPADKVRDLPDLSLFAANGYNYSYYPICANPGDCSSANLTSTGAVVITGVGGTSASSPAMAAIQSLVNQSTGAWAGQADFIYYPLAAKQTTAFHDVTVGGNRVLCYPSTANCVTGSAATNSSGFYAENGYAAGTGYDLATGLGSVDVANLIKYWNTITFTPTTTTLSVSPTSLVHGKTATVTGTVASTSGTGTPTGAVSLTGNDGMTHYTAIDDLALTAGSIYASVDNLPGGTYQLTAVYGGDGSFAASKSAPVTVTVTPENDTLAATGWAWNPYDLNLYALSSGITLPYGAQIFLDAQPVSANATIASESTPATGTVTFTDKLGSATITSTQPLNAAGLAEWSTGVFAPGSHTVSESYSGDPSYNPSAAAAAASFTVIPGRALLSM